MFKRQVVALWHARRRGVDSPGTSSLKMTAQKEPLLRQHHLHAKLQPRLQRPVVICMVSRVQPRGHRNMWIRDRPKEHAVLLCRLLRQQHGLFLRSQGTPHYDAAMLSSNSPIHLRHPLFFLVVPPSTIANPLNALSFEVCSMQSRMASTRSMGPKIRSKTRTLSTPGRAGTCPGDF